MPDGTIRVDVSATKSPLTSLNFVTLKIKDAVCDKIRQVSQQRPSVDTRDPDIPIQGHLTDREFTLYLDTTGEPLFKRGQRIATGEAPLRENLAAGILRLAGWTPGIPLLDPMCGSGTILVEAARMALDIAPGLGRQFAFEKFQELRLGALARADPAARTARRKAQRGAADLWQRSRRRGTASGAGESCGCRSGAGRQFEAGRRSGNHRAGQAEGIIVSNPPYGVRLGEQQALAEFYPKLGDVLKKQFTGWRAYFLSADMRLPKLIRLAASKRTPLFNGALECRLFEYKMVEGGMRKKKPEPSN